MRHFSMMLHQVKRSSRQAGLFVLCMALSLTTLTALSGFSKNVNRALLQDARSLHAADIIIRSYDPISIPLLREIETLVAQDRVMRATIHEFYSVVRASDNNASVLSRVKSVSAGYPFYGQVSLQSGRPFKAVIASGNCIVEQSLLDRIGVRVGESLKVGHAALTIADVVTAEPDRPLDLVAFGPRIFVHDADLENLGLLATGSRIRRSVLLKVQDPQVVNAMAERLAQAAPEGTERIDTYLTARSAVKRYLDNFLFFLKLVGLFVLVVAGMGMQSTLVALFSEKRYTIAIMKAVGASGRFVTTHFALLTLFLAAVGTTAGILTGCIVQATLEKMVAPLMPEGLRLSIAWGGVAEAALLGVAVAAIFSFLPLYRLGEIRPATIFNRQPLPAGGHWPRVLSGLAVLLFFTVLVIWHMRDIRFGLYFVAAVATLILCAALVAHLALWGIGRLNVHHLALRQALRGLFRQGGATRVTMITLTVALAVIFCITLIERNLTATFVQSYPADSPNAFFIDIQPNQTEAFTDLVGSPVDFFPIVRARVTAVNGEAINQRREGSKRRDNLSRVFNLTYREQLLADERLIRGETLFRPDWDDVQVSVMDTVLEMRSMEIGDRIHFNIQGVPLTARIASVRARDRSSLSPFFYFVFPTSVLAQAPQTLFATLRVAPGQLGGLQNKIVSRLPNVSVIDMSETVGILVRLMARLSKLLQLFSMFGMFAGMLILVSAVFATRAQRMVESVYYKILGAGQRFVAAVFALENLIIGLLSGGIALLMAQAGAWWVCSLKFGIGYRLLPVTSIVMVGLVTLLVIIVGWSASRSIMAKKPVTYLREQQNG